MTSTAMNDLREAMLAMTDIANEGMPIPRQVTHGATLAIMHRSLGRTGGLPVSLRQHLAFRDLSDYISLSQKNKSNLPRPLNTDLLPVCNPMSTRTHAMTASGLRFEQARWITADPRMVDAEARALVAALLTSDPASMRFAYYSTRVAALPQGLVPLEALVAAFGSGNSTAARSARAKMQRRDRKGRFAWMGGGLSALVRRMDGSIHRLSGRMVAQGTGNDNTFDMELPNGALVRVPAGSAESFKAYVPSADAPDGFSPVPAQITSPDGVIDEKNLVYLDAPNGFHQNELYQGPGIQYTDDTYTVTKLDPNDESTPDPTDGTKLDFNKPVYVLENTDNPSSMPLGVTQSWATTQDAIRIDELAQDKKAGRKSDPIAMLSDADYNDLMETTGDQNPYDVLKTKPYGQHAATDAHALEPKPTEPPADPHSTADQRSPGKDWYWDPNKQQWDLTGTGTAKQDKTAAPSQQDTQQSNDPFVVKTNPTDYIPDNGPYTPKGWTGPGDPGSYTDDPAQLAQMFPREDLVYALEMAVTSPYPDAPASGQGLLTFKDSGGESDEMVPAEALYHAIGEQGGDPQMELAKIYDANLEDDSSKPNETALEKHRKETGTSATAPEATLPAEQPAKMHISPDSLKGLTPEEAADAISSGDYVPYLLDNTDFYDTAPDGYYALHPEAYVPLEPDHLASIQKQIPGFFDNPMELAALIPQKDLAAALRESVEPSNTPGQGHVSFADATGDYVSMALDGEAVRDALQLQGVDTNAMLGKIYDEGLAGQENLSDAEAEAILKELYPDGGSPLEDVQPGPTPNPNSFYSVHPDGTIDPSMEYTDEYLSYLYSTPVESLTTSELSDLENVIKQVSPQNEFMVYDKKTEVAKEIKARSDLGLPAEDQISMFDGQQYVGIPGPHDQSVEKVDLTPAPAPVQTPEPTPSSAGLTLKPGSKYTYMGPSKGYDGYHYFRYPDGAIHSVMEGSIDWEHDIVPELADGESHTIAPEDLPTSMQFDVPQIVTSHAGDLQAGDVTVDDHFTITSVYADAESEAKKPGSVWVEGYYPGHVVQKTKLWYADTTIQAYRGITPPQPGDKPALSKPKPKEYDPNGKVYKHPVNGWVPSDKQAQLDFADAQAAYDAALEEATNSWTPPEDISSAPFTYTPDMEPLFSPGNHVGTVDVVGSLLQPGDVTFKKEYGKDYYEFFIVESVDEAGSAPGSINVIGHYPGHETQTKTWKATTSITAMRGVDNPPAPGPLPALERPSKSDPDYAAKKAEFDAKKKASAETFVIPVETSVLDAAAVPGNHGSSGFTKGPKAPTYPAFSGQKLAAIFAAAKGNPIAIKNALKNEEVTYIDFESTGGIDDPQPIQVAIIKKQHGKETSRLVMYINPGQPLDEFNLTSGNVHDPDGNPVTDEFLATQPSQADAMAQVMEFIGPDAIVVAHNMAFDGGILKRKAAEFGLDYSPAGEIDTLALARTTTSIKKNDLKSVADYYQVSGTDDNWHDAVFDTSMLSTILGEMFDELGDPTKTEPLPLDFDAQMHAYIAKHQDYIKKLAADKQQAANLVMAKVWDDAMADGPAPDLDQMIESATVPDHVDPDTIPDGSGVDTNPNVIESVLGGFIDDNWVNDPTNTTDIGKVPVEDWKPGDFIEAKLGGWHEIISIQPDPDNEKRVIVTRRLLSTGKVYGSSWIKYGKYTVRRRNESVDAPVPEPVLNDPAPVLDAHHVVAPDGSKFVITVEVDDKGTGLLVFVKDDKGGQAAVAHVSTAAKAQEFSNSWANSIMSGKTNANDLISEAAAADVPQPEDNAPEKWNGYDIVQDKRGVWHAVNLSGSDVYKLKSGALTPPHLPFFAPLGGGTGITTGEGYFFSTNGSRYWGQFGAAGTLVRRQNANGEYEYLLALRSTSISTGGGTWSTPGGAHKDSTDASIPGETAKKEFQEELGVDITSLDPIAISVADVAPDWKYETVIFEVAPSSMKDLNLGDGENTAFDWFTADQLHYLQAEGKLHPSFSDSLDGLLSVSEDNHTPDPSTPAPETVDPVAADLGHVFDMTGWVKVGGQSGSNPGGFYADPQTGQMYYVKFPKSDKHAANEVLASSFYEEMGVPNGRVYLGKDANGNTVLVSPIIDGNPVTLHDYETSGVSVADYNKIIEQAQKGFITDAWLNNWDSVGLAYDNMMVADGVLYRIDPGASLLFRAQGVDKSNTLTPNASTVDSLRDPGVNPQAADIFGDMTDAQLKESAQAVADISPEKIDQLVDAAFPEDKQTADFLKERLKARREGIMKRFGLTPATVQQDTGINTPNGTLEPKPSTPPADTGKASLSPGKDWFWATSVGDWLYTPQGQSKANSGEVTPQPEVWKHGNGDYTLTKQPDGTWKSSTGVAYTDETVQSTVSESTGWIHINPAIPSDVQDAIDAEKGLPGVDLFGTDGEITPEGSSQIDDAINNPGSVTFNDTTSVDPAQELADSLIETADAGDGTMSLDEIIAQQEKFKSITSPDQIIAAILERPGSVLNSDGTITLWHHVSGDYEYAVLVRKNPDNTFSTLTTQTSLVNGTTSAVEPYTPKHSYTALNNHIEVALSRVGTVQSKNLDFNKFFQDEVKKAKKNKKNGQSIQHLEDTHISADGVTKVLPGMHVTNVKTGQSGVVIKHVKTHTSVVNGTPYTYTDYTYVKYQGSKKQQKVVSTSLQITDASGNPVAPNPSPTPTPTPTPSTPSTPEPPLAEWEKQLLDQGGTPEPVSTPSATTPADAWDGTVTPVNSPEELLAQGFPKNSASHLQEFGVYDYNDYKQLLKGKLVKDYNGSYNMVPGIIVNDRVAGKSQSHGIVTSTDANSGSIDVTWMTGPKAGTSEHIPGNTVTSDERFLPAASAQKLGVSVDTTLQDEAKSKATQMMKDKAEAAKLKAEAEAKKQQADAAKAAIQAQVNAAMVEGPGVSVSADAPGTTANWTESHAQGVPSLADSVHSISQSPKAATAGSSTLIDSDGIEDLNVRVMKVKDKQGVVHTRVIFKLTSWKGKALIKGIKAQPGATSSDGLEVKRYEMGPDYLQEKGIHSHSGGTGTDNGKVGTTITVPILDANGNTIGTYQIHRAKKTGEPNFTQDHGSNKANVAWHNQVDMLLPENATPEQIAAALEQMGLTNVRPARPEDMETVAGNKIISIFGNKTVGTENLSGPARLELLAQIKTQWGIDPADVTYEVAPGSSRGDIQILMPEEVGKKLAAAAGQKYFAHSFYSSNTSGMSHSELVAFYADLMGDGRANGMYSSIVRRMEGLPINGMSPSSDQSTTGAHYIFTSITNNITNGADGNGYGTYFTYYAADLLRRLDWYANSGDGFGQKAAEKDAMKIIMGHAHETMFRTGIPWSALAGFTLEGNLFSEVISELKARGITMIGNTPIEEFEKKGKK